MNSLDDHTDPDEILTQYQLLSSHIETNLNQPKVFKKDFLLEPLQRYLNSLLNPDSKFEPRRSSLHNSNVPGLSEVSQQIRQPKQARNYLSKPEEERNSMAGNSTSRGKRQTVVLDEEDTLEDPMHPLKYQNYRSSSISSTKRERESNSIKLQYTREPWNPREYRPKVFASKDYANHAISSNSSQRNFIPYSVVGASYTAGFKKSKQIAKPISSSNLFAKPRGSKAESGQATGLYIANAGRNRREQTDANCKKNSQWYINSVNTINELKNLRDTVRNRLCLSNARPTAKEVGGRPYRDALSRAY